MALAGHSLQYWVQPAGGLALWWMSWMPHSRVRTSRHLSLRKGPSKASMARHRQGKKHSAQLPRARARACAWAGPVEVCLPSQLISPTHSPPSPQVAHARQRQLPQVALLHPAGHQRHGDVSLDAVDAHPGRHVGQDAGHQVDQLWREARWQGSHKMRGRLGMREEPLNQQACQTTVQLVPLGGHWLNPHQTPKCPKVPPHLVRRVVAVEPLLPQLVQPRASDDQGGVQLQAVCRWAERVRSAV